MRRCVPVLGGVPKLERGGSAMSVAVFVCFMLGLLALGFLAVWFAVMPAQDWSREDFELRDFTEWRREQEGRGDAGGE